MQQMEAGLIGLAKTMGVGQIEEYAEMIDVVGSTSMMKRVFMVCADILQ